MKPAIDPGGLCAFLTRTSRAKLCVAALVLLAGCDGGPPPPETTAAPQRLAEAPGAEMPEQARVQTSRADEAAPPPDAASAAGAPLRWALQALGEIERPDGLVERSYRVTLHNGGGSLSQLVVEALPAAAGVQVKQGKMVLGDVGAGAVRSARDALTLVHAADWVPDPGSLHWTLRADAGLYGRDGALLTGAPEWPATAGLRDWHAPLNPGWRIEARLNPKASLGDANEVLQQRRLRIAQMRSGNHMLMLHPVGSASESALKQAVQALPASGSFLFALLMPPPAVAGAGFAPDAAGAAADPFDCSQ